MTALRIPGLGPIIGHTTHESCRIWVQAADPEDKGTSFNSNRRTIGVIGLMTPDRQSVADAFYFRLHREFDRTGIFTLGKDVALGHHMNDVPPELQDTPVPLQSDTQYSARVGTLSIDDPLGDSENVTDFDLVQRLPAIDSIKFGLLELPAEGCEVTFRTSPKPDAKAPMAFLLGSCRYPGLLWKTKEADQIFRPMARHLAGTAEMPAARFTVMAGDQIYADLLNRMIPVGRADTYSEFQERYQTAFSSTNMRQLLKTAPTYMILDDHEIEDNWAQDRMGNSDSRSLFNFAIGAYMSYQWSHGPRTYGRYLYYQFDYAQYPFFVLDARTQRYYSNAQTLRDNHLLGRPSIDPAYPGQLAILLNWLTEQKARVGNAPKFIVSSSVFAPSDMGERIRARGGSIDDRLFLDDIESREESDSWPAFPMTRKAIVEHIVKNNIQNVVFLTGDIHCSNIAQLRFKATLEAAKLIAYDITSSAFYWPFPFADGDPNNYVHDSELDDQYDGFPFEGGEMHYRAWAFTQEDNFCRLDVDPATAEISVRYFDRKGNIIKVSDQAGKSVAVQQLKLAPWA